MQDHKERIVTDFRSEGTFGGKLVQPAHLHQLKGRPTRESFQALSSSGEAEIAFPEVQGCNYTVCPVQFSWSFRLHKLVFAAVK